ncbi:response regulator receiver [Burkholderiales bacterium GJ-E10]|nr:response regulator receiver [Burkholderiales bacterium GJ-E10]
MTQPTATPKDVPAARSRILLADGGRISHSAAAEAVRRYFDVREAPDAGAAWQAVLLDPAIRVVVADFSAPPGAELIQRMRASKVERIRDMPAVALLAPGSDVGRDQVAVLDATAIEVPEDPGAEAGLDLVVRLRVLAELAATREALVETRTQLESAHTVDLETQLLHIAPFDKQVEKLLSYARRCLGDVALICIRVELKPAEGQRWEGEMAQRIRLVGRALSGSVRLEDLATHSDEAEFCVATQSNGTVDMLQFAARLRKVLENVDAAGPGVEVWTYIGVATLSEELQRNAGDLRAVAQRRAQTAQSMQSRRIVVGSADDHGAMAPRPEAGSMDIHLALALIASGRAAEVVPHLPRLLDQINPLLRLLRQQQPAAGSPGTKAQ